MLFDRVVGQKLWFSALFKVHFFLLDCFDAGSAGVGDLAGFHLLAIVEAPLRSMVPEAYSCL